MDGGYEGGICCRGKKSVFVRNWSGHGVGRKTIHVGE